MLVIPYKVRLLMARSRALLSLSLRCTPTFFFRWLFFSFTSSSAGFTVTISTFAYSLSPFLAFFSPIPLRTVVARVKHYMCCIPKKKLNRNVVSYIFIYLFTFLLPSFTNPHYRIQHHSTFSRLARCSSVFGHHSTNLRLPKMLSVCYKNVTRYIFRHKHKPAQAIRDNNREEKLKENCLKTYLFSSRDFSATSLEKKSRRV